jgi:methyl-accepting chemotaxis protein
MTMLQASEIKQKFTQVEQAIGQASRSCQSGTQVSQELKQCIDQLDEQASRAHQVMESNDQSRMVQCVDELESLGDKARNACRADGHADPQLKAAVTKVHDELSKLKHQLH